MENTVIAQPSRMHPLMVAAAVSVTLVSLIGVAAITGILPSSHSTSAPSVSALPLSASSTALVEQSNATGTPTRYVTSDGKVFEEIPGTRYPASVQRVQPIDATTVSQSAPVVSQAPVRQAPVHHTVVHHARVRHVEHQYANNTYAAAAPTYDRGAEYQPAYAPEAHPVVNYINDMHPVGTGVGAVLGGVLGNQVGGGNGKKLATIAGVLFGGYAGNEVAHNRSPLPGQ